MPSFCARYGGLKLYLYSNLLWIWGGGCCTCCPGPWASVVRRRPKMKRKASGLSRRHNKNNDVVMFKSPQPHWLISLKKVVLRSIKRPFNLPHYLPSWRQFWRLLRKNINLSTFARPPCHSHKDLAGCDVNIFIPLLCCQIARQNFPNWQFWKLRNYSAENKSCWVRSEYHSKAKILVCY